ncbi:Verru_Chthon cassette protein D [Prosthecobacter debontii]|uniref:Verru_Chthon cassette protein D n=1 Tax=Prosthecobacter debontii TaxID=48467 RepID=A0A1T4XGV9_9BACT|nr:Verru_Chthon cassette protein D [Prosthecobacter debontii]SKA88719.1 Verru_Chthon cassette protein D [Prosthecobacter debontii]
MKMKPQIPSRQMLAAAFTLLEVMVVVVILSLLLALLTPPLISVMESNRLTQSGQSLLFRVSMAQQLALTENRPVEMRFFNYADDNGVKGFHAAQLFFFDETDNVLNAIESPLYFNQGVMISDSAISPLIASSSEKGSSESLPAEREPFKSRSATYKKIVFYPNGSTSINLPLRDAYATLCSTRATVADASSPPQNYYTIQIDPVNGNAKSYRPQ